MTWLKRSSLKQGFLLGRVVGSFVTTRETKLPIGLSKVRLLLFNAKKDEANQKTVLEQVVVVIMSDFTEAEVVSYCHSHNKVFD